MIIRLRQALVGCLILIICFSIFDAHAETLYVSGYSDDTWTYAVIRHNGVEYHTNKIGSSFNQQLWDQLDTHDKLAVAAVYGWRQSRLDDDFGPEGSKTVATFAHDQSGWSDLVTAMKNGHSQKTYPEMAEAFGPHADLNPVDYATTCWQIVTNNLYLEALRLDAERQADFALGQQIYQTLKSANWDELAVAIKDLSEPLEQTILSQLITPLVTDRSSRISNLVESAYILQNDLRTFLAEYRAPGATPIAPDQLINLLNQYLVELEQTGNTAALLVKSKTEELEEKASEIKGLSLTCIVNHSQAAAEVRGPLFDRINSIPAAEPVPIVADPVPGEVAEEEREQWIFNNLHDQATTIYSPWKVEVSNLSAEMESEKTALAEGFAQVQIPDLPEPFQYHFAGITSGFDGQYRELEATFQDAASWTAEGYIQPTLNAFADTIADFDAHGAAAETYIDTYLPRIDSVHARALGLEPFAGILGVREPDGTIVPVEPSPLAYYSAFDLRNFSSIVDIIASPAQTLVQAQADIMLRSALAASAPAALENGLQLRQAWLLQQLTLYSDLRLQFESSLNEVITCLNLLNELHTDPYFSQLQPIYLDNGMQLTPYTVDPDALLAQLNAAGDAEAILAARVLMVEHLHELRARESSLIQRLSIAESRHFNDHLILENFFTALQTRLPGTHDQQSVISELTLFTGTAAGTVLSSEALVADILPVHPEGGPDITYYFSLDLAGNPIWVRHNSGSLTTNIATIIGNISGKIPEYYELEALYNSMVVDKGYFLSLPRLNFKDFMNQTIAALYGSNGYLEAFESAGVFGATWPAWHLLANTDARLSALRYEYNQGSAMEPLAWEVSGEVATPDGFGVSGLVLILTGTSATGDDIVLATTTSSSGEFIFQGIDNGTFLIKVVDDKGYSITPAPATATIDYAAASLNLLATPTATSGFTINGQILDPQGNPFTAMEVILDPGFSEGIRTVLTDSEGNFNLSGLEQGTWTVYPVDPAVRFTPDSYLVELSGDTTNIDFVGATPGDITGDSVVDLKDIISLLKVMSGQSATIATLEADVNRDGKLGLADSVFMLQQVVLTSIDNATTPPIGPDIAGNEWLGTLDLENYGRQIVTAVITHIGSRVTIRTNSQLGYGRIFRGDITSKGYITVIDQTTQKIWTTHAGRADSHQIHLYDYVNNFTAFDTLFLVRK